LLSVRKEHIEDNSQTTGTPKACYVCYKPTATVLATIDTVDFLYTCTTHLDDYNFASKLGGVDGAGGGRKMGLSEEEIAKVKQEWEEKQKMKAEKEKEKAKEAKEKADAEKDDKDKDKEKEKKDSNSTTPKTPVSPPQPASPKPTHDRYALHRDFFASKPVSCESNLKSPIMYSAASRAQEAKANSSS
jgi:hypothetical protein